MLIALTIIILWAIVESVFITAQFFVAALLLLIFICLGSATSYLIDGYVGGS
jgi:hypothetical protein